MSKQCQNFAIHYIIPKQTDLSVLSALKIFLKKLFGQFQRNYSFLGKNHTRVFLVYLQVKLEILKKNPDLGNIGKVGKARIVLTKHCLKLCREYSKEQSLSTRRVYFLKKIANRVFSQACQQQASVSERRYIKCLKEIFKITKVRGYSL